ncbi:CPBP family intramembrane glutamic endopeptidase [Scatolibacter rhodanostii]|uniref:CPBP family intramembrane glutamic endopeptidase n=1 Tax=Scatolibacter rhodanostii TaxID=2014781 RepID=UPI000C085F7A|nr:CPBP family intramembrane glutamic endopeptidase [Scatolibacter rhodanostii]
MTMIQDFISAIFYGVLQLLLFALIPLTWWLFTARKNHSFFVWIGLHKTSVKSKARLFIAISIFVIIMSTMFSVIIPLLLGNVENATTQKVGKGITAIPSIIVYSYIQTGLSEEVFFRGFIGKRLMSKLGFIWGNTSQAFIFGAIHSLFYITQIALWRCLGFGLLVFIMAWVQGYLNEKVGKGSIVPSILCHGTMNALSGIVATINA